MNISKLQIIGAAIFFFLSGAFIFFLLKPAIKYILAHLVKPTPERWRKLGDMCLSVSGTAGSFAFVSDNKQLAYALFACAVMGKIICSLSTKTDETDSHNNDTPGTGGSDNISK